MRMVRVSDKRSKPQYVNVLLQGVPVTGVIDEWCPFQEGDCCCQVKEEPIQESRTYISERFNLDGHLDLDITFIEKTMKTPVYLKMEAVDELLLSEGVCSQLDIVSYHKEVKPGLRKDIQESKSQENELEDPITQETASVPLLRVNLVRSVSIPPRKAVMAEVRVERGQSGGATSDLLMLEGDLTLGQERGLEVEDVLLCPDED